VGIAGYGVRMARKLAKQPVEIEQITIERQCDNEFIKDLAPAVEGARHLTRLRVDSRGEKATTFRVGLASSRC
jgi:hypothetical protein